MIGDYLFVAKWPYGYSRHSLPFGIGGFRGPDAGAACPSAATSSCSAIPGRRTRIIVKRVIGLPGDTIEVRGGVVILNGRRSPRQRIADYAMPISPNSPCRGAPEAVRPRGRRRTGETLCLYPRYRETLPGGRSYEVLDQMPDGDGDDFGPVTVPARPSVRDGRQSRRQLRQPLPDRAPGGVGLLPVENVLGEAMIAFWSTDGSAEWLKPWTWFTRGALEPDRRDLLMAGSRRLARGDSSATGPPTSPCSSARSPIRATARTITSGSNSSATACSAWSIADWLIEPIPDEPEGKLSHRLNALVAREVCAEVARELGVAAACPARQAGAATTAPSKRQCARRRGRGADRRALSRRRAARRRRASSARPGPSGVDRRDSAAAATPRRCSRNGPPPTSAGRPNMRSSSRAGPHHAPPLHGRGQRSAGVGEAEAGRAPASRRPRPRRRRRLLEQAAT